MEILFSEAEILDRVRCLGGSISEFYQDQPLTILTLLNGALIFAADLARNITCENCFLDCLAVYSYAGHDSSGELRFRCQPKLPCAGRHILLVDWVLDTGLTLSKVSEKIRGQGALSVRSCVLAEKIRSRSQSVQHADWAAFKVPDRYLVGCGMDSKEKFRQLPYLAALS
jgi:hypoxanthine phosphoribosyltransferase